MSRIATAHGILRGTDNVSKSPLSEGRFGRMFRDLPPAQFGDTEEANLRALKKLGDNMTSKAQETVAEAERNIEKSSLPAGYTFLGQFIDHDITFDPASSLERDNDPDALIDFRTPRLDLDSIYGRGPVDQPYLYRSNGLSMVLGRKLSGSKDPEARDVPRNIPINPKASKQEPDFLTVTADRNTLELGDDRAIIGDPRNDENVILAQLHAMFLRFHNRTAKPAQAGEATLAIGEVQQLVRWHYQWLILHDFLPRVVAKETYAQYRRYIRPRSAAEVLERPPLQFYRPKSDAYIPIEFSVAAYRFGHSTVRPCYRLNRSSNLNDRGPFAILGKPRAQTNDPDLRGFKLFQIGWAIDWDLFFGKISPNRGRKRLRNQVQAAKKINTSLVEPLGNLPFPFAKDVRSLAQRNLIRSWRLGLPSGQDVASAMGVKPLSNAEIRIKTVDTNSKVKFEKIGSISPAFEDNTPLWVYILAEAQDGGGNHLGPVGSRILMETFVGLLLADGSSFLRQDPLWKPDAVLARRKFDVSEFIREARKG